MLTDALKHLALRHKETVCVCVLTHLYLLQCNALIEQHPFGFAISLDSLQCVVPCEEDTVAQDDLTWLDKCNDAHHNVLHFFLRDLIA